jgi:hypothetical protein
MKIILNKTEEYIKKRKEYEDGLKNNIGGIYTQIINEKTREGREKIIEEDEKKQRRLMDGCFILGLLRNLFLEQYKIYLYRYDKEDWDCEEIIWDYDLGTPTKEDLLKFFEDNNIKSIELYGELCHGLPLEKIMEIVR